MRAEVNNRVCYRFAHFEVSADSRELRKNGVRLKLREQAFRILVMLLERRGEIVTRDELRTLLWSEDTFVDFDKGLNTAVNKVREVLSDSVTEPRFLETIPRHGYRFIAEVETVIAVAGVTPVTERDSEVSASTAVASAPPSSQNQITPKPPRKRSASRWLMAIGSAGLAAALLSILPHGRPISSITLGPPVQITNDGIPKNELVTDGVRVFYAAAHNRNLSDWRSYQVSLNGGEPSQLIPTQAQRTASGAANQTRNTLLPAASACPSCASYPNEGLSPFAISADHTQLLLGSSAIRQDNDLKPASLLWSLPLGGGPARALSLRALDASWSPDGKRIAFATTHQIGLAKDDGTMIRILADLPGIPSGLRWSPSGDLIRFTLHYDAGLSKAIWEISLNGGQAHPLFPTVKNPHSDGEWTPDGRFYFFSETNNGASQIWALREKNSWFGKSTQSPVQLTTGPMQTFLPTPAPDGKHLVFYGVAKRTQVLRRNPESRLFQPFLPGVSGACVRFSADGKWISYTSYPENTIWRAAADGSQRLQLSPPDMMAILPVISPDGARIAFLGGFPERSTATSIYVVDRDGSNLQTVVATYPRGIIEPWWSPDSKSLVLSGMIPARQQPVLYRYDFATGLLTVMPGSEGLWSPRWSPDGRFIVALGAAPVGKLMLYDLASHQQVPLTPFSANHPMWSHDGQYIYFRGDLQGDNADTWCRIGLRHRDIEAILDLNGVGALPAMPSRGRPSWINWWIGLAPDDSMLVPSDEGGIEIYSASLIEH